MATTNSNDTPSIRIGVDGLMPKNPLETTAERARSIRDAGFTGVGARFPDPTAISETEARDLGRLLADAGLTVCQTNGAYPDLVSEDSAERRAGIDGAIALCRIGAWMDADSVYVRPGSMSAEGSWFAHPDNTSPRVFDRLVESMQAVTVVAESEGVDVAVEGHVLSPLHSLPRVAELIDRVGSDVLGFNADVTNFIGSLDELFDTPAVIDSMFDLLGDRIVAAHMKDCDTESRLVIHIAEVLLGTGRVDVSHFVRRFVTRCPGRFAIIEHLPDERVPEARANLGTIAADAGIEVED